MKKIIIVIVSLLFFNAGFSKELKIKVISMGEPLAYSYISINGDVKTITDSIGFATLPMNGLNVGDTISASFVGYNARVSVFDTIIKEKGELVMQRNSELDLDRIFLKRTSIFKTHIITQLKDKIRYKGIELDSHFEIDVKNWKFDKRIQWEKVSDLKILLETYSRASES